LEAGTIFKWQSFPDKRDPNSSIKTRWFIYFGKTGVFISPVILYMCTTTTQLQYYQSAGPRENHKYISFKKGQYGFEDDCILDIDINFYSDITEEQFSKCSSDIEIIQKLPEDQIRRIYKIILHSARIPKIVKRDIHQSLNIAGISGLKLP
jgi:hypothetical protein